MSYSIKVTVVQTNNNAVFRNVENGIWYYANGGTWSGKDNQFTLKMGGSGTSGMLRFMTEQGKEAFFVAMGVHDFKPWLDVITGLGDDVTCVRALPDYYKDGSDWSKNREALRTQQTILNIDYRNISAEYKKTDGHDLELQITIG